MGLLLTFNLPVPVGALLGALAVPYLTCALRLATVRAADRGARLVRNLPGLGSLALAAACWSPYLADTVPVPAELAAPAIAYLLTLCAYGWLVAPTDSDHPSRRTYEQWATPLGLLVAMTVPAALVTPLVRPFLGA
ncbi:hypothetical protein ACWC5I_28680 [Kitasatospora sp. NPDC001574]